jgi:hypothetical protein
MLAACSVKQPSKLACRNPQRPALRIRESHRTDPAIPDSPIDRAHAHPDCLRRLGWSHECWNFRIWPYLQHTGSEGSNPQQLLLQISNARLRCFRSAPLALENHGIEGISHATEFCGHSQAELLTPHEPGRGRAVSEEQLSDSQVCPAIRLRRAADRRHQIDPYPPNHPRPAGDVPAGGRVVTRTSINSIVPDDW